MRIAQIAPIIEQVPPLKYGGTERIVSTITEELVKRGHQVTLFAAGNSVTNARLQSFFPRSLREVGLVNDPAVRHQYTSAHISQAYARANQFDLIHDHTGLNGLPFAELISTPVVSTIHGAIDQHAAKLYGLYKKPYYVSISEAQGKTLSSDRFVGTVHHGLPLETYPFEFADDGYLLYVGRITPIKGTHIAVKLAHQLKLPLILAAKLDDNQRNYFDQKVAPYLSDQIQWIGEVDEQKRNQLMSRAKCFLHPGLWDEPFGLTMIEAMACGCPVVAFRKGSIPEVVEHGKTGFVANNEAEFAKYIGLTETINRKYCRVRALQRFTHQRMVTEYERIYSLILHQKHAPMEKVASVVPHTLSTRAMLYN